MPLAGKASKTALRQTAITSSRAAASGSSRLAMRLGRNSLPADMLADGSEHPVGCGARARAHRDLLDALDPPPDMLELTAGIREQIDAALASTTTTTAP